MLAVAQPRPQGELRNHQPDRGGYLGQCPCLPAGQLDPDERTLNEMTLAPFHSGRKQGTPNKITAEIKELGSQARPGRDRRAGPACHQG
jgi:hypothetical protein